MQTIMNRQQQNGWAANHDLSIVHKWSSRGYGNSKILNGRGDLLGKANGCGYDRYGAALGEAITALFPGELAKLAKRHCVGTRRDYKQPKDRRLYGLFFDAVRGRAWVDGGCGSRQMELVLNAIGFGLDYVGESAGSHGGEAFYRLRPVNKREREWLRG